MNSTEEIARQLQMVAENIEVLGLNDSDGWSAVGEQLQAIALSSAPDTDANIACMLTLCIQGINAIAHKTAGNTFAIIDAVEKGMTACGQYLEGTQDSSKVNEIIMSLQQTIPGETSASHQESVSNDIVMPLQAALNDFAAMWIQQEPDDSQGVSKIREALLVFSGNAQLPESVKLHVLCAVEILDAMLMTDVDDISGSWQEAGACIDKAMQLLEFPDSVQQTPSETRHSRTPMPESPPLSTPLTDSARDYMPDDPDADLIGEFIAEAADLIANAEEALLELEVNPEDMDAVGTVFRAFHTIKGTSAFLELTLLSEMGHHAESLLSRVRDKEIRYQGGYADLALKSLDMLKTLIHSVEKALGGAPLTKPEKYDSLMEVLKNPEASGVSEDSGDIATPRIGDILVAQGKAERNVLETAVQNQHAGKPLGMTLVDSGVASVTDVGQALRTQNRIKNPRQAVETSVRVSTDRLDRLIDMVGEMVIAHSMVSQDQVVIQAAHYELLKKVNHTSKIVRELQDLCMSMRMVPLKATFQKMARLVRDVARKVGKNVTFITEGEDTEIDRNLVDIINDPLVHMVRNAVDHGIELPDVRNRNGKPANGTVKLSAYHSAGSVVVQIIDDGKGLDKNAILAKAIEKGMISDGVGMSDRDIFNLVLEPGFSTAAVITDVSGRGVGMDVVKKNIESLRGQIEIQSESGKGSVFRMSLPLTLAIIDGMVIRAGHETYVIPTVSIVRSIKPDPKDISTIFNQGQVLSLQGNLIPLYRLTRLYNIHNANDADIDSEGLVVVIEDDGNQAGLIIDELVGRQQVVIKTLGETMQQLPGISGGAIMPNGRVGLIVDIAGLMKLTTAGKNEKKEETYDRI